MPTKVKKEKEDKSKTKRLVLLDAHAILHRAYHALPDFASSKGEPTGALYGLSTMLIRIINDLKPDYLIACYDLPGPTYRHEAYEQYKATRKKADDELISQMKRSREVFEAFHIPIYEAPGFEADDILGTVVEQMKNQKGLEIIIASGDMDTLQLVDKDRVKVYTIRKGLSDIIFYDEKAVLTRFGFGPDKIPDYKGLRGDPSDNIPGIAGIGEKTASILIQNFGGIVDIYKKLKKDEGSFEKAGIKKRIIELLKNGEEEAEFSMMLATIRRDAPVKFILPKKSWAETFDEKLATNLFLELDFRTLGDRLKRAAQDNGSSIKEELVDDKTENISDVDLKEAQIALWLISSNITSPTLEDILGFTKTKDFSKAKEILLQEIKKKHLEFVFEKIEKPLTVILEEMNKRGISVDVTYLKNLSKKYHTELSSLQKIIWSEAGEEFNINSPKQLGEVLFDKMGIKVKNQKRTGTGARSTKESELEKMKDENPVISKVLEYRELQKLLSTYIDNIPEMLDKEKRLHTTFLQTGTTTGRISSVNPNLQNIPIKTELGRNIRHAFVASEGFELVAIDYSQIELRVAAIMSEDPVLLDIFRSGGDIHSATASRVFGVSEDRVDKEMRRKAKVINFGILYGMGINALRANLQTSREEAQQFLESYFKAFSGLAVYLNKVKSSAERNGFTETIFGRRRYFEGIKSKIPYIKASAERMAVNAPFQGTAADIMKIAMIKTRDYIKQENLENDVHLLLSVHDELVYEVAKEKVRKISLEIKNNMESVLTEEQSKGVPIVANASVGRDWGEMRKLF